MNKKSIGKSLLCIGMSLAICSISVFNTVQTPLQTYAATFEDINDSSVFLKQSPRTCTLCSAAMLLRRTAILRGDSDWRNITESSIRSTAWKEGAGLYLDFTYDGIHVSNGSLNGTESQLIDLLDEHPEGIIIYNTSVPHAVLLTDYKDGTFWAADPANNTPRGRIPLTSCYKVRTNNVSRYWYVEFPDVDFTNNDLTIRYNANGGTIADGRDQYVSSGGAICDSDGSYTEEVWEEGWGHPYGLFNASTFGLYKDGYEFLGWSLSPDSGRIFGEDEVITSNDLYPDITKGDATITLYARWSCYSVTIRYNAFGGTIADGGDFYVAGNGDVYNSDDTITEEVWEKGKGHEYGLYNATTFGMTRKNCEFLGWSLETESGRIIGEDEKITSNDLYPDVVNQSGTVKLYAQWGGHLMTEEEGAGQTLPDGDYWIANALDSSYIVHPDSDETATTGTNVRMNLYDTGNWSKNDLFTIKYLGNGFYNIIQKDTCMAVSTENYSLRHRTNIVMMPLTDQETCQWSIKKTAEGYTVQSRSNALYFDVKTDTTGNSTLQTFEATDVKSQLFCFIPYASEQTVEDGVYRIGHSLKKGVYVDAEGSSADEYKYGTNIQIFDESSDDCFRFEYCTDGKYKGYYKIYENRSGLALDVDNPDKSDYMTKGMNVQLYTSNASPGQYWDIKPTGDGYYYIISRLNGYYLDLLYGNTENGTNISVYQRADKDQKWSLITAEKFIVTQPTKTIYALGDKLDSTGLKAKLVYSDGYECDVTNQITAKNITTEDDLTVPGIKQFKVVYGAGTEKMTAYFYVSYGIGSLVGDVNMDGSFSVADVVLLQKWLLAVPDIHLSNWKAADLCADGHLDVFDLCLMKRKLIYG